MEDVYKNCPIYEDKDYTLRLVRLEDKVDLLKVYSDEKAIPFFNGDNCGGDDFHYTTENRMEQAIEYWLWEYSRQGFVRWTIVSKAAHDSYFVVKKN